MHIRPFVGAKCPLYAVLLFCLALPGSARAQDAPQGIKRTGLELALRTGFAIPVGEAQEDVDVSDVIAWHVPLQLDVGYREERVTFGLYLGYGFGSPGDGARWFCDEPDVRCSAYALRAGIQLLYYFAPKKPIGGYLGAGVGYEQIGLAADVDAADAHVSGRYRGVEMAFQGGVDFRAKNGMSLGPFMSVVPGRYLDSGLDCTGQGCTAQPGASIGEESFHTWIVLGLRGALLL
jgi:hypothetical protein